MKVFKFGGASVNTAERIRNLPGILNRYPGEKIMVIISAMGKTTNALEEVVRAFFSGQRDVALQRFREVKESHLAMARALLTGTLPGCETRLRDFFTEAEWLLHDRPVREYDYYYDQIVSTGELYSTSIVSAFLDESGFPNQWLDVRDVFRTDDDFRDADIDWEITRANTERLVRPLFMENRLVLTQGFIGATAENESTTLGREGSDYSAAVFANLLDAEDLTIWKDVESVMNADPKQFSGAIPIPALNYNEVIEMAYYGAQIIHPKTIKPLQNKGIPMYVKSFLDPELPGTIIHDRPLVHLPPILVLKENQVLLDCRSRDFEFIGEHHVGHLYKLMEGLHLKPNITQYGAIRFLCILDEWPEKIEKLASNASGFVDIQVIKGLSLLTIRHYTREIFEELTAGKKILLRQQTPDTIQLLLQ
ncbi:MAG: aspartate kinase [Chitinophagaceae bacterium]